jgi:hypothetical protein
VGGVNFGVTSFSSPARARHDLREHEASDKGVSELTVTEVPGLGQEAIAVTDSMGAYVMVMVGARELVVNISWPRATSPMAVTLARDALRRM